MTANQCKQVLINEFKNKEMSPEDFENTLNHFAELHFKEQLKEVAK